MNYFFDTSALVKIYHKEKGSEKIINIYSNQDKILISELAKVEFYSTIYRKYREREIDFETLTFLSERFIYDTEFRFVVLKFSSGVTEQSIEFFSKHGESRGLKALDSLQLSFFDFYCEKGDTFVTCDSKLINIAKKEKMNTLNP